MNLRLVQRPVLPRKVLAFKVSFNTFMRWQSYSSAAHYNILAKNVASFYPCPQTLAEDELRHQTTFPGEDFRTASYCCMVISDLAHAGLH